MEQEILRDQGFVAERLGCSVRTLERWRVSGDGPAFVKLGHLVRYRDNDIAEWLVEHSRRSTSEAA